MITEAAVEAAALVALHRIEPGHDLLWGINNDGTITIPSALTMRDTPLFISAGIAHNDRIIASRPQVTQTK